MKNKNIITLVLMPFLLLACSSNKDNKAQSTQKGQTAFLERVQTVRAELSNQDQELILAGKVSSDPEKTVSYTPIINGVIDRTYFSLGDKVVKGQDMLKIRSTELSSLLSEKLSQETEVRIAQRELKTAQSMYEDGMFSESELFEAEGKLQQAQAELHKTKTDIAVYGVQNADGTFSVKSPLTGYVIEKNASSGNTLSEGSDPLFTIADLSSVWVIANVYASNLKFVREGMEVEITSLSYPGEVFYGKISSIPQVFDAEEKVLKARIVMKNPDLKFKPEMAVVVKVKELNAAKCVAIPSEALIFDHNQYFVVIEKSEGQFEYQPVTLQGHHDKISYIASGLKEGDLVVTNNQLLIYSSLKGI
ncbi:efflux RND transporter periplasmic adaptor subunit [Bacteroides propionicifaciens]|uniref:efflux RND transporter periplasmic adaptor subunit n=1 Tax=Bacteroides propionicifaciens TaxID=392838 RepID=UPI000363CCCB|nr:efflux RND transporter periplasmic adaptor subunit [Bacteroides propionicifaciens]